MSKSFCFRTLFLSQRVNGSQTLLKSARYCFYLIVKGILDKLSWKKLVLVRSEILGLFVETLAVDDKYSYANKENFLRQIQMQLSQKPKTFSDFLIAFMKSKSNSSYFQKKLSLIA